MKVKYNEIPKLIYKKEYNLGVNILRVFLSFSVIMDHLYNKAKLKKYFYILYYHIPTFFLISFFFTYNTLISYNITKIKLRFERLIIPYIYWSIIGFILKIIYYKLNVNKKCSLKEFVQHLICGHILNVPLWYLVILILTTQLFLIINFIFKNNSLFIFHTLIIICYILQYSGINYYFITKYLTKHAKLTFGRFIESIPNEITGYTFAYLKIIEKLRYFRLKTMFFSFSILIIITKYNIFDNIKTFKYGGIRLNIASSCIFILFSLLPIEKLKNKSILKYINHITSYTGGVFYMHYLVGTCFLIRKILKPLNKTILGCMIIYLICYLISYFGIKICGKTKLKYMFI
jgi:hypothetical protein